MAGWQAAPCQVESMESLTRWHPPGCSPEGTIGRAHVWACRLIISLVCSRGTAQAVWGTALQRRHMRKLVQNPRVPPNLLGCAGRAGASAPRSLPHSMRTKLSQVLSEVRKSHLCQISRFFSMRPERDMALLEDVFIWTGTYSSRTSLTHPEPDKFYESRDTICLKFVIKIIFTTFFYYCQYSGDLKILLHVHTRNII